MGKQIKVGGRRNVRNNDLRKYDTEKKFFNYFFKNHIMCLRLLTQDNQHHVKLRGFKGRKLEEHVGKKPLKIN